MEDDFPFQLGDFLASILIFSGVSIRGVLPKHWFTVEIVKGKVGVPFIKKK